MLRRDFPKHRVAAMLALVGTLTATSGCVDGNPSGTETAIAGAESDPFSDALAPHLTPTVQVALDYFETHRRFEESEFPKPPEAFRNFQAAVVSELTDSLALNEWVVRGANGKESPLSGKFSFSTVKRDVLHGVEVEVIVIRLHEIGLSVPAILCLPATSEPRPGVAVFSGHSLHGLRDLVIDLESYQAGLAIRLAQAGFATIAVEKLDTGYLSRSSTAGDDEFAASTLGIVIDQPIRRWQLMAVLAAVEVLALHERVDETRIGAAGVSLGGWLSIQTALLSDRIVAVADFGRKTLFTPQRGDAGAFEGIQDLCYVTPRALVLGDRNLQALAYAPRPLLVGHGSQDEASEMAGPVHYRALLEAQYEALGSAHDFQYHVHGAGDVMPAGVAIDFFNARFKGLH